MNAVVQQKQASERIVNDQKSRSAQLETNFKAAESEFNNAKAVFDQAQAKLDQANAAKLENLALIEAESAKLEILKKALAPKQ